MDTFLSSERLEELIPHLSKISAGIKKKQEEHFNENYSIEMLSDDDKQNVIK